MTRSNKSVKILGVTGNSGSGKSFIANEFAKENNGFVISADEIAHKVMEPGGAAYREIVEAFGEEILTETGDIDRKILGAIVFSDSEKRELLEKISHKHVIDEIDKIKGRVCDEYRYIIIDAPLLIEANMQHSCDEVWVVYADVEKRLERVIIRDGISREDALKRFSAQTPFEVLKRYADRIIEN